MGHRRPWALLTGLLISGLSLALASPASAGAAVHFAACGRPAGIRCASLPVPIDRSGQVPGSIALHVERIRGGGRAALLALAGGPGETNTNFTASFGLRLHAALRTHDLYVFDQRGTGRSGALHCDAFERGVPPEQSVPACATALGPRRNYYTTAASAQDIEALRRALGVSRLAIYGVSYGTYVAQAYAALFPEHVESLVLDSAFAPSLNRDPFELGLFRALPGTLNSICARRACRGITANFAVQAFALLNRAGRHPLIGTYFNADGRPVHEVITALGVAAAFPNIDLRPGLRAELPRAVAGAVHGDLAPLARLVAGPAAGTAVPTPKDVNETLNLATLCEERDLDFSRTAPPAQRLAQARAALQRIPAGEFAPFSPQIAFAISEEPLCAYWPSLPTPPALPTGKLPAVPALILAGASDLRTPPASAREVAARLPRSRILTVPFVGHSVVSADDSGCALQALAAFYAGRFVQTCHSTTNTYPPRPLAPTALSAVQPVVGLPTGAGRLVAAAELTVQDAFEQLDPGIFRLEGLLAAGGLRGGSYRATPRGLVLHRDTFVPGVAVSGLVPAHGTAHLTLSGRTRATLTFTEPRVVSVRTATGVAHGSARIVRATVSGQLDAIRRLRFARP